MQFEGYCIRVCVLVGSHKTARSRSTTKQRRTERSRHPTFPVNIHATSSVTICSTVQTNRASSSRSRTSTSKAFRRGTHILSPTAAGHICLQMLESAVAYPDKIDKKLPVVEDADV